MNRKERLIKLPDGIDPANIVALFEQGKNISAIQKTLKISRSSIVTTLKRSGCIIDRNVKDAKKDIMQTELNEILEGFRCGYDAERIAQTLGKSVSYIYAYKNRAISDEGPVLTMPSSLRLKHFHILSYLDKIRRKELPYPEGRIVDHIVDKYDISVTLASTLIIEVIVEGFYQFPALMRKDVLEIQHVFNKIKSQPDSKGRDLFDIVSCKLKIPYNNVLREIQRR